MIWQKFGKETGGNYTAESEQSPVFSVRGREAYLLTKEATLLLPKGCVLLVKTQNNFGEGSTELSSPA